MTEKCTRLVWYHFVIHFFLFPLTFFDSLTCYLVLAVHTRQQFFDIGIAIIQFNSIQLMDMSDKRESFWKFGNRLSGRYKRQHKKLSIILRTFVDCTTVHSHVYQNLTIIVNCPFISFDSGIIYSSIKKKANASRLIYHTGLLTRSIPLSIFYSLSFFSFSYSLTIPAGVIDIVNFFFFWTVCCGLFVSHAECSTGQWTWLNWLVNNHSHKQQQQRAHKLKHNNVFVDFFSHRTLDADWYENLIAGDPTTKFQMFTKTTVRNAKKSEPLRIFLWEKIDLDIVIVRISNNFSVRRYCEIELNFISPVAWFFFLLSSLRINRYFWWSLKIDCEAVRKHQ